MDAIGQAILQDWYLHHLDEYKKAMDAGDAVNANAKALCVIQHLLGLSPDRSYTHDALFYEIRKLRRKISKVYAALGE